MGRWSKKPIKSAKLQENIPAQGWPPPQIEVGACLQAIFCQSYRSSPANRLLQEHSSGEWFQTLHDLDPP